MDAGVRPPSLPLDPSSEAIRDKTRQLLGTALTFLSLPNLRAARLTWWLHMVALLGELTERAKRGSLVTDEERLHLSRCLDAAAEAHAEALTTIDAAALERGTGEGESASAIQRRVMVHADLVKTCKTVIHTLTDDLLPAVASDLERAEYLVLYDRPETLTTGDRLACSRRRMCAHPWCRKGNAYRHLAVVHTGSKQSSYSSKALREYRAALTLCEKVRAPVCLLDGWWD